MSDSVAKVVFDESLRAIDSQVATLDGLRGRAGTLLAVASLVTAFLGGQVLAKPILRDGEVVRPDIASWGWLAIVAFVGVALLTLVILFPYDWRFELSSSALIAIHDLHPSWPAEKFHRELALRNDLNHTENAARLEWLFWCFRSAILLLVVQTIAWIIELK